MGVLTIPEHPSPKYKGAPLITNRMKAEVHGEHGFEIEVSCGECLDVGADNDCHLCGGDGTYNSRFEVPWDTCKEIYKHMVAVAVEEVNE